MNSTVIFIGGVLVFFGLIPNPTDIGLPPTDSEETDSSINAEKATESNPENDDYSQNEKSDNFEYHKIIYGMSQGIFKLWMEQYYFIKNEKAYVLTFTAEADKFNDYKITGEKILNSFLLKK